MQHFQEFEEICLSMEALEECLSAEEKLVFVLGSLSEGHGEIIRIIENMHGMDILNQKK